jgi:putative ABC transport system permease protein
MVEFSIMAMQRRRSRNVPTITAVNIFGLALGLACFLAAWGMSSYWAQNDRHFKNTDNVYVLTQQFQADGNTPRQNPFSAAPAAKYVKEEVPELQAVARLSGGGDGSLASGGKSIGAHGALADPELFEIFDFKFVYGSAGEALKTRENIVITQNTAEKLFGKINPVGRSVVVNAEETHTIAGVIAQIPQPSHMGETSSAIRQFEYLRKWPEPEEGREEWWLSTSALTYMLLPQENKSAVRTKLDNQLSSMSNRRIPEFQRNMADRIWFDTTPLKKLQAKVLDNRIFQDQANYLTVTSVLFGLGLVILLVSCINYANLATAQAAGFAKEVGLRKVVGAGRNSIIVQYWLEALLLTIIAGILALVFLAFVSPLLQAQADINLMDGLRLNKLFAPVLIGLVLLVSVLASLYPVAFLSRIRPVEALRSGRIKGGNQLLTQVLVGTQFAAASALLILVIVVGQQNRYMRDIAIQPDKDPVAVLVDRASISVGTAQLREALSKEPSIISVSGMDYVPWSNHENYYGMVRSREENPIEGTSMLTRIDYNFLETFQATLIAGRDFDPEIETWGEPAIGEEGADLSNADVSVIIDRTYAEVLGFQSPKAAIGQELYLTRQAIESFSINPTFHIIGVVETVPLVYGVGDVRSNYYELANHSGNLPAIRIDKNNVKEGVAAIERAIKERVPDGAVTLRFTDSEFEANFKTYDGISKGFIGLSLIALVISSMGLFAMAVFTAIQRRSEIGIRKTLGASTWEVTSLLIRDFSRPVLLANIIAWPLAWYAATTYLNGFMQHIDLTIVPWITGLIFTMLIAWLAVGGQAFSAARVKPAEVLKSE